MVGAVPVTEVTPWLLFANSVDLPQTCPVCFSCILVINGVASVWPAFTRPTMTAAFFQLFIVCQLLFLLLLLLYKNSIHTTGPP